MSAMHFCGGVTTRSTEWLRGWACCCSGRKCEAIPAARLTYNVSDVTCQRCVAIMRKDRNAATRFPTL